MTLREAIQRVLSKYSKGVQSKDSRLTPRHAYSALMTARSTVIRNQYNKSQRVSQWSYQELSCVKLIKAPIHECPCVPAPGCLFLKTKYPIPTPITGLDDHLIQSVSTLDGSKAFDKTTFETLRYSKANKYTSTKGRYFIKNSYIYVVNEKELKGVVIPGLFDDPIAAYMFPSACDCTDCDCRDPLDMEFPLDGNNSDAMFKIADQELIYILKQMGEDKNANASDDDIVTGLVHQPKEG